MRAAGIVDALKSELKRQGLNYRQLAKGLGLSEAGIKRMFAHGNFSLQRLEEICVFLGLDDGDLFSRLSATAPKESGTLTLAQEVALAADDDLGVIFHFLAVGKTAKQIRNEFGYSEAEFFRQLHALDQLGVIELGAGNRVRLKILSNRWLRHGPLATKYGVAARQQFIDWSFKAEGEIEDFCTGPLSPESLKQLGRRLKELFEDFDKAARFDKKLVDADLPTYWFYGGIRSWDPLAVIRRTRLPMQR